MKYGYIRVSTEKQDFLRQQEILSHLQLDRVFEEKITGKKDAEARASFNEMLLNLKAGDSVYFESMSRMGRNLANLIETSNHLVKELKVNVYFLKENISLIVDSSDFNSSMTNLIFNIMGAFAQFERDLIADRTRETLQAKKAQGVKLGRPLKNIEGLLDDYTLKTDSGAYAYDLEELSERYRLTKQAIIYKMKKQGISRNRGAKN